MGNHFSLVPVRGMPENFVMDAELLKQELSFRTARSGGKGGQHVNKVETKAEALLDINASRALDEAEKVLVFEKLANHISAEGILAATSQTERSQLMNKVLAEEKLLKWVQKALVKTKPRKATRIPASIVARRLEEKRKTAGKKSSRKNRSAEDWLDEEEA